MQRIKDEIGEIYRGVTGRPLYRPIFLCRVQAGFPSPADNEIAGRIDFSEEFVKHPLSTFWVRAIGDSMEPLIYVNSLLMVDRMEEARDGDIVIACVNSAMTCKELSMSETGRIWLLSKNERYPPIEVGAEDSFEVWGTVLTVIHPLKGKNKLNKIKRIIN